MAGVYHHLPYALAHRACRADLNRVAVDGIALRRAIRVDASSGADGQGDVTRLARIGIVAAEPIAPVVAIAAELRLAADGFEIARFGANAQIAASNDQRLSLIILNNSAGIVYLGNATGITAANGLPLAAGASLTDTYSGDAWWCFNGQAGTADVRVLETSGD